MPRAPTKTLVALLFVNSMFTLGVYAVTSFVLPGWAENLKAFALCTVAGILVSLSLNQILKKEESETMFGRKENGAVNWEERVKPAEVTAETAAEVEERSVAKMNQKDLSPKKIFEMVKALAESVQLTDEATWVAIKEQCERAAGAMAWLESALQAALDASKEVRYALEELSARVGEHC